MFQLESQNFCSWKDRIYSYINLSVSRSSSEKGKERDAGKKDLRQLLSNLCSVLHHVEHSGVYFEQCFFFHCVQKAFQSSVFILPEYLTENSVLKDRNYFSLSEILNIKNNSLFP